MILSMEIVRGPESFDPIIDDRLFLGNLSAAESPQTMTRLGVTHVLSVCPDPLHVAANIMHLTIPIQDDDESNILQYLPEACTFIHDALTRGGKVFVHCVMGISRSATVVCAYLMYSRHISTAEAIQHVRKRRAKIRPNYNFTRQLQVYSACEYDVAATRAPYRLWLQEQAFDIAHAIRVVDAMPIMDRLFLSFDLPSDLERSGSLLDHLGITHVVSINPDRISSSPNLEALSSRQIHKHFIAPYTSKESLLLLLPLLCKFVTAALQATSSRILLHCMDDSRAALAICAYIMFSQQTGASEALRIVQDRVPFFEVDPVFLHQIELFAACQYEPTHQHPLVRVWLSGKPLLGRVGVGPPPPAAIQLPSLGGMVRNLFLAGSTPSASVGA
ncbi:protein-tyrosine phosphatase-like protein [Mycena amicta]|nr:protein-tyrosine phosphatase-like protein [Mycena amicta]